MGRATTIAAALAWALADTLRDIPGRSGQERRLAQLCADGVLTPELSNEFGRTEQAIDSRLLKIGAAGPAADQARLNAL